MIFAYLIIVYLLYSLIKYIIHRVREHIEDKAIEEYNFKSQLAPYYHWLDGNNRLKEYKSRYQELRTIANDTYPELQERIERDGRRDFYVRYILPGKRRKKSRRY